MIAFDKTPDKWRLVPACPICLVDRVVAADVDLEGKSLRAAKHSRREQIGRRKFGESLKLSSITIRFGPSAEE